MASLDSLPADQKAVLSLVLQRGQSFDQIAALLFIDRAAVRQRALEGLESLGPDTSVDPLKRGLITDYLLGQLPSAVSDSVYNSLASNPPERAWARVIAAEIAPLAVNALPEIPAAGAAPVGPSAPPVDPDPPRARERTAPAAPVQPAGAPETPRAARAAQRTESDDAADLFAEDDVADRYEDSAETAPPPATPTFAPSAAASAAAAGAPVGPVSSEELAGSPDSGPGSTLPSSRRGGAILLALIALVVIVVVVVLLVTGGSSKKKAQTNAQGTTTTSTAATASGTSTTVTPLHQINLISPTGTKGREGAADVVRAGGKLGIVIVAEGLTANVKNAYGVWLYNSKSGAGKFLGFYDQQVTNKGSTKGELEAEDQLPANATSYNELLLTLETAEKPTKPGTIVLQGTFAE
jgi:hypothetical protein